jgi:hypothetical protein
VLRYAVNLRVNADNAEEAANLLAVLAQPVARMLVEHGAHSVGLTADEWDDEEQLPADPAVVEPGILLLPPGQDLDAVVVDALNDAGVQVRTS